MNVKIPVSLFILYSTLFITGCSTLITHKATSMVATSHGIYRGTREDAGCVYLMVTTTHELVTGDVGFGQWSFYLLFGLVDLPLSLVADTVCLPYDLTTLGYTTQHISYDDHESYRIVRTDNHGKRHGKNPFQLLVYDSNRQTVKGYEHYRHGTLIGKAEAWDIPLGNKRIIGEYRQGVPWNGSFLMHAGDTNYLQITSINQYEQGVLTGSTPIAIVLKEKKSKQ